MIRQKICVLKYKNPSQTMSYIYDKPNFKERKIFLKDNESAWNWVNLNIYQMGKKLIRMINSNY